jgi:hypothetical protein
MTAETVNPARVPEERHESLWAKEGLTRARAAANDSHGDEESPCPAWLRLCDTASSESRLVPILPRGFEGYWR